MDIASEFAGAPLPDRRLRRRLERIAARVATEPSATFPTTMRTDADLEAFYRFINNERIEPEAIAEPHSEATRWRAAQAGTVLAVHDETEFEFDGDVGYDLGYLTSQRRGFEGMFTLVLQADGLPLGIAAHSTQFRENPPLPRTGKLSGAQYAKIPNKESRYWAEAVERASELLEESQVIHVIDREGDSYALLSAMVAAGRRFVVRLRQQRRRRAATEPQAEWETLGDVAERAAYVAERMVALSRRTTNPDLRHNTHAPRGERPARLHLEASAVVLPRPRYLKAEAPELGLNLVRVHEVDAPAGDEPVEWWLITNEPIATCEDVEAIVDIYRHRWKIEEYFKALKTGCAYTERDFESREALLRTLALLVPIAWQLLLVRDQARLTPGAPAKTFFSEVQLVLLREISSRRMSKIPTLEEAIYAIAEQGGHLKRNGAPGWQTIGRGLERLWWAEYGYFVAAQRGRRAEM